MLFKKKIAPRLSLPGIGIFLSFLLLSLFCVSCNTKEKPLTTITFADATSPYSAPLYVADKKGFFKEEGLNVQIATFTAGRFCLDALLGGKADFAMVADMPIMRVGFTNQDISIISTIAESNAAVKLIARKDRGIDKPSDLKGKKIGTLFGTSSEFFLSGFLEKNGISEKSITKVNIDAGNMPAALIRGDLDAYDIWEPYIQSALNVLKGKAVVFVDRSVYTLTWNVLTRQDILRDNFDAAKRLVKALVKAENFIKAKREESIKITADAIGMKVEDLTKIWDDYTFDISLDPILTDVIIREVRWAIANDPSLKGSSIPDYHRLIDNRILKEVRPRSVLIE